MKQVNPFYKGKPWLRKREIILRRDGYECRQCARYGKPTQADTVHHVIPLEDEPRLALVNKNLISLCNKCHGQMHNRVDNTLTQLGVDWVERLKPNCA